MKNRKRKERGNSQDENGVVLYAFADMNTGEVTRGLGESYASAFGILDDDDIYLDANTYFPHR